MKYNSISEIFAINLIRGNRKIPSNFKYLPNPSSYLSILHLILDYKLDVNIDFSLIKMIHGGRRTGGTETRKSWFRASSQLIFQVVVLD